MKICSWTLLFLSTFQFMLYRASSQTIPQDVLGIGWVSIDCGNLLIPPFNELPLWSLDKNYTTTGITAHVSTITSRSEMASLRFFPDSTVENCYTLPSLKLSLKYLIRAGFYYGNYDSAAKPPTFDLYLDGKKWSTVNTTLSSVDNPLYHEIVYVTQGSDSIELCLAHTRDGEVPFISSIEIVPLWNTLYNEMGSVDSFDLVTRINLGGPEVRNGIITGELHNRIWTRGANPPNTVITSTVAPILPIIPVQNEPPVAALIDSVQSNPSDNPIILTVDLPYEAPQQTAYFVFYFTELLLRPKIDDTRIMDIYVNGKLMTSAAAELALCKVVTLSQITVGPPSINITLAKSNSSTLPPMISAMEVFTKVEFSSAGGGSKSTGGGAHRRLVIVSRVVFVHVVSIVFMFWV
ncbi:Probable LRR receptor-like serine/threonine-protein kinase MEE39 [Linum perenne]